MTRTVISRSAEDTRALAARMAGRMAPGTVVALHGDLGSGKTCFVQGLARGLGVAQPVTSPTFTLVNEYSGDRPLYHIDLYRIGNTDELFDLGFEDYLHSDGVTAVEWAERADDLIPTSAIEVWMAACASPSQREIRISGPEPVPRVRRTAR